MENELSRQYPLGAAVNRSDALIGTLCGLAVIAIFAGFTLASRVGFSTALTPMDIVMVRFGVGGAILLPVFLGHRLAGLSFARASALAFTGGLGFALIAYTGLSLAPASHGAVIMHGSLPLFTYLILRFLAGERADRRRRTGLVLIAAGVGAMAYDSLRGASLRQLIGDGLLLLGALCWSSYGVLAQRWQVRPTVAAAIVAVFSMLAYLPAYLLWGGSGLLEAPLPDVLLQVLVQGVIVGGASIFVYSQAVNSLGAARTALFTAAVPCVTTLAAIPLLSEWPSAFVLAGVAVVSIGLVASIWNRPAGGRAN